MAPHVPLLVSQVISDVCRRESSEQQQAAGGRSGFFTKVTSTWDENK